jgi:hypothetical protein
MKGGKNQTVTTKPDQDTLDRNKQIWERTMNGPGNQPYTPYGGQTVAGVSDLSTGAAGHYNQGMGLGSQGMAALGGDANAAAQFMNPYQQQVMGAMGSEYDRMRNQASLGANDDATRAGAFGGDRHALMVGERQGALDRAQMSDTANLLYGGFNDAMGRAGESAGLGMGAAGGAFGAGDYFRGVQGEQLADQYNRFIEARDWDQRGLDQMRASAGGMQGGQTQSQPMQRNLMSGAAGGAATGAAFGPMGALAGGGIGLGMGLLGW